jgi:hypothetical protein
MCIEHRFHIAVVVAIASVWVASCSRAPTTDVLALSGGLDGPNGALDVNFEDARSRGEWWPCDGRLTAQACVDAAHVNVFFSLPVVDRVQELGSTICVEDGVAAGAFEIMERQFKNGQDAIVGEDVSAFIVVGSDENDDAFINPDDPEENAGSAHIVEGTIELFSLNGFDQPLSMIMTGETAAGDAVSVTFLGPMSVPAVVPPPESSQTCVAAD